MAIDKNILTTEDAERILSTPKIVVHQGHTKQSYILDFDKERDFRIYLAPTGALETTPLYLLRVRVSEKTRVKISLHVQENELNYCLLRIDFNGPEHTNPNEDNGYLPDNIRPFVGQVISSNHIHYHVQGYKSAAWAIPIEADKFPVKNVEIDNYMANLKDTLLAFSNIINLETKLSFSGALMFL